MLSNNTENIEKWNIDRKSLMQQLLYGLTTEDLTSLVVFNARTNNNTKDKTRSDQHLHHDPRNKPYQYKCPK